MMCSDIPILAIVLLYSCGYCGSGGCGSGECKYTEDHADAICNKWIECGYDTEEYDPCSTGDGTEDTEETGTLECELDLKKAKQCLNDIDDLECVDEDAGEYFEMPDICDEVIVCEEA